MIVQFDKFVAASRLAKNKVHKPVGIIVLTLR